jgi:hypothetical protein
VPPENLPSVINATLPPNPAPIKAEVGFNISGIPGPPFGPSFLITNTCPALTFPSLIPAIHSNSLSKTFAGPENDSPSLPVIFATEPSGARLPYNTLKCPVAFTGLLMEVSLFDQLLIPHLLLQVFFNCFSCYC